MNKLFEKIKKREINGIKRDLQRNKERIRGIYSVIESQGNRLKQIPKEIEEHKSEIELLEGQMELMLRAIENIKKLKALEEEE